MPEADAARPFRLEQLRIATPCPARWEDMAGDERVRHCRECDRHVFDLSAMTRAEATDLVRETTGRLCVRLWRRGDGRILTADCPVGLRRRWVRRVVLSVSLAVALVILGLARLRPAARPATPRPLPAVLDRAQDFVAHTLGLRSLCTCRPFIGVLF